MASDVTMFDEADLNAFTDGRLEPARAAALAESLGSDRLARARIDGWKRQNESLRSVFASVLFEPVPVRLLQTTLAGTAPATGPVTAADARTAPGGTSAAVLAMTAIGVALVGFMAGALATIATDGFGHAAWASRNAAFSPAAAVSTLPERAAEAYRAALADPERAAEFSAADEARLQRWMVHQLSGTARIPDLHLQGWKLLGGRVVSGRYAPAAFLLYGQGGERLGLYLAREPVPAAVDTPTVAAADVAVNSWAENGLGAALTSTRDLGGAGGGEIDSVREVVRRQITDDPSSP